MIGIPFLERALFQWLKPQSFDDSVDRLNYFITSSILMFFAIMVSAKQYVGSPIQCWMPMEFKGGWEQYAEDYCFIQNTFFVPFHSEIPGSSVERQQAEIGYYQWVPIVLALQALMFFVPNYIWKQLHTQSGIDLGTAVKDAAKLRSMSGEERKQHITSLAQYIEEIFEFQRPKRSPARIFCFRFGSNLGSYMSLLYIFVKLMYLTNILLQFYILNRFIGTTYTFWGWETLVDLMNGRQWNESGVFPRVTLCDFEVRRLANVHRYTVQCVLMINMFNEKIYLFIWFWFLLVAVVTCVNVFYSIVQLLPSYSREKSTRNWLMSMVTEGDQPDYAQDHMVRRFTHNALRPDGVLLMRFIESHAGAIVARELAGSMYGHFLQNSAYHQQPMGVSTKSTSPGIEDDGPHENIYEPEKMRPLLAPDYPTKY